MIGEETKAQILAKEGRLPDAVIACVGGGSNAIGIFADFIAEKNVKLIGVEPADKGIETGEHGAPLKHGKLGIFFGMKAPLMRILMVKYKSHTQNICGLRFSFCRATTCLLTINRLCRVCFCYR